MKKTIDRVIIFCFNIYRWFYRKNLYALFHVTIKPSWNLGETSVRIISHETFTEEKLEEYKKLRNKVKIGKFIEEVLTDRSGIRIVTFASALTNEFVQFSFEKNDIVLDFPMAKDSPHEAEKNKLLSLLNNYHFIKVKEDQQLHPLTYQTVKGQMPIIRANFGGNTKLVSEFTLKVYKQIYKVDPEVIEVDIL